jgi:hypothetical protein
LPAVIRDHAEQRTELFGSVMAARWLTFGVASPPQIKRDVARPGAMA